MGLVHRASLDPTKQQLVEAWLPSQTWAAGRTITDKVAEYRFDDPEGEVGVETILWTLDDGSLIQTPLTYRAAPLDGAEGFLVGTTEHSVLGSRWVYDGCGDPVWAATLSTAVLTGGTQAQMVIEHDGRLVDLPARMQVRGSGAAPFGHTVAPVESVSTDGAVTTVRAGGLELQVPRVIGTPVTGEATLDWVDRDGTTLAALRRP
jgi:Maltokinase N-terminal cap domain